MSRGTTRSGSRSSRPMLLQSSEIPFDQLLGPYGLLVALIISVYVMARILFKQMNEIAKERDFWRDKSIELLETSKQAVNAAVPLAPDKDLLDMARRVDE